MPKWFATKIDEVVDLRLDASDWEPKTISQLWQETLSKFGDRPALLYKEAEKGGKVSEGTDWTTISWKQYYEKVVTFAKSLIHLGFEPLKVINIIGFNAPEWLIANSGAIAAGGISAGIYTTNGPDSCKYIADHSEAEIIVVEDQKQLEKFFKISYDLPKLEALIIYKGGETQLTSDTCRVPIYTWSDFMDLGKDVSDSDVKEREKGQKPGQCCSLIYTSGTTGPPKAVMLSHDNVSWTMKAFVKSMGVSLTDEDRTISYLPLSHIAAQMIDVYCGIYTGSQIYFAQPDAMKGSLAKTLKEVRPTFFLGVPRVWEKVCEKLHSEVEKTRGVKRAALNWARGRGTEKTRRMQYGEGGGAPLGFGCAHALILSKIKEALGLDQAKFCASSAAPIAMETLEFFASLDLPIFELLGTSESSGPHTTNSPKGWKMGTIGREVEGVKSKKLEKTGEFCMYGRHIMMGYLKMEDKTSETIDEEGWLHTGDIAEADEDGFWSMTGRIKELIITAGGENVPPVLIEDQLKAALPILSNCMLIGDKKKYLTVLFTLKSKANDDGTFGDELDKSTVKHSKSIGSEATKVSEVKDDPKWKAYFEDGIKKVNANATSNAQKVQKFAVLPQDFSQKGDELTPTLKLKRNVVLERYQEIIHGLYK